MATGLSLACACLLGATLLNTAAAQEPVPQASEAFATDDAAMARAREALAAGLAEQARTAKEGETRADASRRLMFDQQPLGTPTTITRIETADRERAKPAIETRADASRRLMFDQQPLGTATSAMRLEPAERGRATAAAEAHDAKPTDAARIRPEASPAGQADRVASAGNNGEAEPAPRARPTRQADARPAPAARDKAAPASKTSAAGPHRPKLTREAANVARKPRAADVVDVETTGSIDPARREPARRISPGRQKREARRARRHAAGPPANGLERLGRRIGYAVRCLFRPGCVTGRQVAGTTVGAVAGGVVAGPPGAVVGGVAGTTLSASRRR